MALVRQPRGSRNDPRRLLENMDETLDRFFGRRSDGGSLRRWTPRTDIYESGDKRVVELEAPGLDRSDFDVSLEGDVLTVEGEKTDQNEQEGRNYRRQERMHGRFQRSFRIPEGVDSDDINATYDNGVLKVELPKTESSQKEKIAIE